MEEKTKAILAALEALPCSTFDEQDEVILALGRALRRYVDARRGDLDSVLQLLVASAAARQ